MACVILPSETARLVYGYLVNENLNDIAIEFLEKSPYLMDCRQIVKSGYQFNTKLMGKNLQDLLQEYSVIHNLANKKVNLLCKTSLLYKRIKLRCESLPEILELILFWKYKQSQSSEPYAQSEKSDKNEKNLSSSFSSITNSEAKGGNDSFSKISNSNTNVNSSNSGNAFFCVHTDANLVQSSILDTNKSENGKTKLTNEIYAKVNDSVENKINDLRHSSNTNESISDKNQNKTSQCVELQISNEFQKPSNDNVNQSNVQDDVNINSENCNISMNAENDSGMPELCLSASVLTIDMNSNEKNTEENIVTNKEKDLHNSANDYDSQIKIVRIEKENQNENAMINTYTSHQNPNDRNITLEDGSVVYVSPEVGNVTIDQEKNQIIVIPIDYYKSQTDAENKIEMTDNQSKNDFYHQKEVIESQEKSQLVYENVLQSGETSMAQIFSEDVNKTSAVDGNIMTETDFLKNRHLMFDVGKELSAKPKVQAPNKITPEITPVQTVPMSLIVLPQAILPTPEPTRYRSILPKKEENSTPSVVIVQPLLDSTQRLMKKGSSFVNTRQRREKKIKSKKKEPLISMCKNNEVESVVKETFNMPTIKTSLPENPHDESKPKESERIVMEAGGAGETAVAERVTSKMPSSTNEEKENLQKTETEKIETPVFVTRRNSKRLSLSTPRRRSHIRALEFETPPKTKEEKKSRTSPKAKVEHVTVERKSVRNTLFKSPVPEMSFKSPEAVNGTKKDTSKNDSSQDMGVEPLNESSIPIATRSPNTKLSDAWENLTGVGCVIGRSENPPKNSAKKMWDADLRCFLGGNVQETSTTEKKRIRKPEKVQKDNRKNIRKKAVVTKKSKSVPMMVSPSKMSLTSKRNTYSINGNEEGSPLRSLLDDLKIVTPFKDIETIRPTEETPLTKLLRENINTIDIDLSMINTPSFPPTPSILITPDLDDVSLIGTNYYSPSKDFGKDKVVKITDYIRVDGDKTGEKNDTKEAHEKVIGDLVSKARELIGIGKENQEDCMKRRPSGKILSMVKIQMLTQCDKKLCENIPINEDGSFANGSVDQSNSVSCNPNEEVIKSDLKEELEEKRKRALRKIKVVKENLSQSKNRVVTRNRKRKRSGFSSSSSSGKKPRKTRSEGLNESGGDKHSSWSDEGNMKEGELFHSTPYDSKKHGRFERPDSDKKEKDETLSVIRQELPPYEDNSTAHPELSEKSRKKFHYVGHFLKLDDISKFLEEYDETNPPKLYLKPSFRRFFQVFYKWLKHPHKHELNASNETKVLLHDYLTAFDKINIGVNQRGKKSRKSDGGEGSKKTEEAVENSPGEKCQMSDEEEKDWKNHAGKERKKDEDTEDGFVSILPLKKRKQTVQQVETKNVPSTLSKEDSKNCSTENVSQTQNFLQDIDVDRFLSQIHGQSNR